LRAWKNPRETKTENLSRRIWTDEIDWELTGLCCFFIGNCPLTLQ
jgi:hypothetical protein